MNLERLVRELERRLPHLPEKDRALMADALREEFARERRRVELGSTVEAERERRQEAETLREILEAINRQASLEETIGEVLKQLSRIVVFDSCSVALLEPDGRFRIIAARGFPDDAQVLGLTFRDEISEALRSETSPLAFEDISKDSRFARIAGTADIRSWAGIPLLVEGDVIGVLCLDRWQVSAFDEEELHRAKAVAFSAAAAIRKAQLHEKVRRYATLMEQVVQVHQAVFSGNTPEEIADHILEGALRVGDYSGGLVVRDRPTGPVVFASRGSSLAVGAPVPPELVAREGARHESSGAPSLEKGTRNGGLFLVPLVAQETHLGNLVLFDQNGPSPDDMLMEAYASRAALALGHRLGERKT